MNSQRQTISESARRLLISLPRPAKSAIVVISDFIGFAACSLLAFWLVSTSFVGVAQIGLVSVITALGAMIFAWWQDLYRTVIRYLGVDLILAGATTAGGAAVMGGVICYFIDGQLVSVRWAAVYAALAMIYVCGSRYFARMFLIDTSGRRSAESVIIYGAGDAGAQLAISLQGGNEFSPIAMVDDDPALFGKKVKGLVVYPPSRIEALTKKTGAARVLLAIPNASRRRRRQVLVRLSEFPVHVQTMPEIKDLVSGKARVDDISDVAVDDLLGRDPVPPNPRLLDACVKLKNVMVTGAGGSIGSELCKQILRLNPVRLVLFELSEPALYSIERKLKRLSAELDGSTEIIALLGSVHHEARINEVMTTFGVNTVYHAAAYKHVPIVEHNLFEGIHNNVFGTLHAVRAAIDAGVETFVLISTDKAVNPTSVMGATKRFAELILQAYQAQHTDTRLCMVRFGNVLESSGSVVPLFKEQIRAGGPVTVTHREIIRYFMTIPEASQLVIQAGSMAQGGEVFVLDMGKPVRIHDLACRMIKLMGLTVRDESNTEGDVEIQYIGLRPAEKLYEELMIGANVTGTEHPRIMRADEECLMIDALLELLDELMDASIKLDYSRARDILLRAVKEYTPANGIDDLVWTRKTGTSDGSDTIVDFPSRRP